MSKESWTIEVGMNVLDVNGEKVGGVDHLGSDYILVAKGWLFPTDFRVPITQVASVDKAVHLNVDKNEVLNHEYAGSDDPKDVAAAYPGSDPTDALGLPLENPVEKVE